MREGAQVVKLEPRHAAIVPHIRQADLEEIWTGVGLPPALAVGFSVATSELGWAVELHGEPVAVFGARRVPDTTGRGRRVGVPWLIATDVIERYPVHFYRVSRDIIREMQTRYDLLENWVHERNRLSVRWLAWADFTIEPPERRGDGMFCRFWWSKEQQKNMEVF